MNPLDFALRKSETALERVMATLALAVVAMLGLVWLSIAATGWLALVLPAPLAAAITGGVTMTIAAAAFFYIRWIRKQPNAEPIPDKASAANTDDLISRVSERAAIAMLVGGVSIALYWRYGLGWHEAIYEGLPGIAVPFVFGWLVSRPARAVVSKTKALERSEPAI